MSRSHIVQPKGPGTGYQLRMRTPTALLGTLDPTSGKPFGSEIRRGLGTRDLRAASTRAAILRGQLLALASRVAGSSSLSVDRAILWAEAIREQDTRDPEDHTPDLRDLAQQEASRPRSVPASVRKRFLSVASGRGLPLSRVLDAYLAARSPDNLAGFKPLALTTRNDTRTAFKHLSGFKGLPLSDVLLGDVDDDTAHRFRTTYLRDQLRLSDKTTGKVVALLSGVWKWATEERLIGAPKVNPWAVVRLVPRARIKAPDDTRTLFTAEEVAKLLAGLPREGRLGSLFRLLLVTGCRVDEVAKLGKGEVGADAFTVTSGKTVNASRWVPVPVLARDLLDRGDTLRLFPEFPVRAASGKAAAASQAFTRERRSILGEGSDGRLSLHSTRHTWKTLARRAGLPEDVVNDLGGWAGPRRSSSTYDHGLLRDQLREAQEKVAERFRIEGYLTGF